MKILKGYPNQIVTLVLEDDGYTSYLPTIVNLYDPNFNLLTLTDRQFNKISSNIFIFNYKMPNLLGSYIFDIQYDFNKRIIYQVINQIYPSISGGYYALVNNY